MNAVLIMEVALDNVTTLMVATSVLVMRNILLCLMMAKLVQVHH